MRGARKIMVSLGRPDAPKNSRQIPDNGAEISRAQQLVRKEEESKRLTCLPRSSRAPTTLPPRFRRRTTFSPPRRVRTRRRTARYRSRRGLDRELVPKKTKTTLLLVVGREDLMTRSLLQWLPHSRCGNFLLHLGTCSAVHRCCSSSSSRLRRSSEALSASDRRLGRPPWSWSH